MLIQLVYTPTRPLFYGPQAQQSERLDQFFEGMWQFAPLSGDDDPQKCGDGSPGPWSHCYESQAIWEVESY